MLVIPALAVLFVFVQLRPHEVFESLKPLTFNVMAAIAFLGYALDVRLRVSRPRLHAVLILGVSYFAFATFTVLAKTPGKLGELLPGLVAPATFFLLVSFGINSFRGLEAIMRVLLALTLLLAVIGVHQGLSRLVCYTPALGKGVTLDEPDGRPCESRQACYENGVPGLEYRCEHPGLLGTHSIEGRVRYRGLVEDPNELSWVIGLGLPIAFAFYERKRSSASVTVAIATLLLAATCTMMTQSRSGQLTFAAVLGIYMVRRFGWRGIVAGLVVSAPVLLLGGRSGEEAEHSAQERLEAWSEGLSMWRQNPFLGVGHGQFTEHHYLTAHNSLVLTLAELGPVGLVLWTATIYCAFKLLLQAYKFCGNRPEAAPGRFWAMALLASLTGTVVSTLFLSIARHPILWLLIGLTGGFYAAMRSHEPDFEVRFGVRDLLTVFAIDGAFVVGLFVYLRLKGF